VLKVLFVILLAATAATFATDNMHHVDLGLVVGRPVHVRLFFLLLTSFLLGCFAAMLMNLYLNAKSGKQRETPQDAERDDLFFE